MNNIAQTRTTTRLETVLSPNAILPSMLAVNSVALLALDQLGGIPAWVKTVAALFLSF